MSKHQAQAPTLDAQMSALIRSARDSKCHIADLLSDGELEQLFGTLIAGMVDTGWRVLPPGTWQYVQFAETPVASVPPGTRTH